MKRITLGSDKDAVFCGVCAGLGDYFGVDPVFIRVAWAIGTLGSGGFGIFLYWVFYLAMPERG